MSEVRLIDTIEIAKMFSAIDLVRCKDCKHAPLPGDGERFDIEWPEENGWRDTTCPYYCSDKFYSRRPPENGFCHLGSRKDGEEG